MVNSSNTSNSIGSTLNGSLSSLSVLGSGPTDPLNSTTIHEIPRPHSTQSHLLEDASSTAGTSGHSSTPVTQSRKVANDFPNGHAFTVGSQVQQDRYAALRDIFDEVNTQWNSAPNRETELLASAQNAPGPQQKDICEEKYSLPNAGNHVISENLGDNPLVKSLNLSKSISSFSVVSASGNSVLTSVRKPMPLVNGRNGTQSILPTMPRCESYSNLSLEMRMTPVSLGSSRGPSPMTGNGVIPIAIAIQESISARFKGADESKCNSVIYGDLKIAFPAGILQTLINNPTLPALRFKLTNASKIAKVLCNKDLIVE